MTSLGDIWGAKDEPMLTAIYMQEQMDVFFTSHYGDGISEVEVCKLLSITMKEYDQLALGLAYKEWSYDRMRATYRRFQALEKANDELREAESDKASIPF